MSSGYVEDSLYESSGPVTSNDYQRNEHRFIDEQSIYNDNSDSITTSFRIFTHEDDKIAMRDRLIFIEALRHYSVFYDLIYMARIAIKILYLPAHRVNMAKFCLCWYFILWMTTVVLYLCRARLFQHSISRQYGNLFKPFYVFSAIINTSSEAHSKIKQFDRLNWTYGLLMRFIVDLPHIFITLVMFAEYGYDIFAILSLVVSILIFIISTIKISVSYPITDTLSLLFPSPTMSYSRISEAAPATYNIYGFLCLLSIVWYYTLVTTVKYTSFPLYSLLKIKEKICIAISVLSLIFWVYNSLVNTLSNTQITQPLL